MPDDHAASQANTDHENRDCSDDRTVPSDGSRAVVLGQGVVWVARWSGRWLLIAAAAVVAGLVLQATWTVVLPVALALVLASVLAPVSGWLRRRAHLPAALAAAVTMVAFLALIAGAVAAIAPAFANQTGTIISSTSDGLQKLQDWVQASTFVSKDQVDRGLQAIQDRVQNSTGQILSGLLDTVSIAGSIAISTVVTLILTFLFLKDGHRFLPWMREIAGQGAGDHLVVVSDRAWSVLGGFMRTQALVSLIDATLIGTGLLIVGVPLAIPLAVLTFAGGFIPIAGAFAAGAIAVLVALVSNGVGGAAAVLIIIVVVQQLEGNVLSPWLQARSMNLHPAVVLLSVTLFGTLFGITGAFLAVPVAAVAAVVLRYWSDLADHRISPSRDSRTDDALPAPRSASPAPPGNDDEQHTGPA